MTKPGRARGADSGQSVADVPHLSVGGFRFWFVGQRWEWSDEVARMRRRVADEITTTFASSYTRHISLVDALSPDALHGYARQATGEKYLVTPNASTSSRAG